MLPDAPLGEANLRTLVAEARRVMLECFDSIMETESARFTQRLDAVSGDPKQVDALRDAAAALVAARQSRD